MKKFAFILALPLLICSCNHAKTDTKNNDSTKSSLNDQSLQCVAIMNKASDEKDAAIQAGDGQKAAACQVTMDSAARENALIGQKMMELEK